MDGKIEHEPEILCSRRMKGGRIVYVSKHAAIRFRDRVRPTLSVMNATKQLAGLLAYASLEDARPEWITSDRREPAAWLVIGNCAAFPLSDDDVAVTCLTPGGKSDAEREAKQAKRRDRAERLAYKRHAKRLGDPRGRREEKPWAA